jgi:hypothetical protein
MFPSLPASKVVGTSPGLQIALEKLDPRRDGLFVIQREQFTVDGQMLNKKLNNVNSVNAFKI